MASPKVQMGEGSEAEINLDEVPVRVNMIHVEGVGRTKDDFLTRNFKQLLRASTFQEMVLIASEIQRKLESNGCFKNVAVVIDTSQTDGNDNNVQDSYDVTFLVKEFGRYIGSAHFLTGANDGSISVGLKLPNVLGRGEGVHVEHVHSIQSYNSTSLSVLKPVLNSTVSANLYRNVIPNPLSGFVVHNLGGVLDVAFQQANKVKHNFQWEGVWRQIDATSKMTSLAVRESCGHSFKSAVRHIVSVDGRDHPIFPTSGSFIRAMNEFAGIGGDVSFLKHESRFQVNQKLPFNMVFQGTVSAGLLTPFDSGRLSHSIHDLFFIGGPHTLRGFELKSLGSRSGNDYLGGRAYWTSALHLYSPLPFGPKGRFLDNVLTHMFVNFGNISNHASIGDEFRNNTTWETATKMFSDFRAALGLGVAVNIGNFARAEINYCWPLKYQPGDKIVQGIQMGIGVEFL